MVRPGAPNTALSSYASGIVREPLKGQKAVCPVSLDFPIFICSPGTVIANFVHLLKVDGSRYPAYTRTTALPGISATTQEILDALEKVGGKEAVELVEVKPEVGDLSLSYSELLANQGRRFSQERVLRIVATWPHTWVTDRAISLGCKRDTSILDVVQQYKQEYLDKGQG